jgi:hypothetical protein
MTIPKCPKISATKITADTSSESPKILNLPRINPRATIKKSAK